MDDLIYVFTQTYILAFFIVILYKFVTDLENDNEY